MTTFNRSYSRRCNLGIPLILSVPGFIFEAYLHTYQSATRWLLQEKNVTPDLAFPFGYHSDFSDREATFAVLTIAPNGNPRSDW